MLIKFRNPREGDIGELVKLAKKHGFDAEDVMLPLDYSRKHCFVMEAEGKIVGAHLYIKIDKELAYSSLLFIEQKYEEELAGELEESALLDLKKLGVKRLIGTVNKKDKKMFGMFAGMGWKKAGETDNQILIFKELD